MMYKRAATSWGWAVSPSAELMITAGCCGNWRSLIRVRLLPLFKLRSLTHACAVGFLMSRLGVKLVGYYCYQVRISVVQWSQRSRSDMQLLQLTGHEVNSYIICHPFLELLFTGQKIFAPWISFQPNTSTSIHPSNTYLHPCCCCCCCRALMLHFVGPRQLVSQKLVTWPRRIYIRCLQSSIHWTLVNISQHKQ